MKKIIISFIAVTCFVLNSQGSKGASSLSFEEISNEISANTDKHFGVLKELNPLFSPTFQVISRDSPYRNTKQNNNLSLQILGINLSCAEDFRPAFGEITIENEGFDKTGLTISAAVIVYKSFSSSSREVTLAYRPQPLLSDSFREIISFPLRIRTQINIHLMQIFQATGIEIYVNYDRKFDTDFPFLPDVCYHFPITTSVPTFYPRTEIVFSSISSHQVSEIARHLPQILVPVSLLIAQYAYIAIPRLGTNPELTFPFPEINLV